MAPLDLDFHSFVLILALCLLENMMRLFLYCFVVLVAILGITMSCQADVMSTMARIVTEKPPLTLDPIRRTITLPLFLGRTKSKENVWFIITDCSDRGTVDGPLPRSSVLNFLHQLSSPPPLDHFFPL